MKDLNKTESKVQKKHKIYQHIVDNEKAQGLSLGFFDETSEVYES